MTEQPKLEREDFDMILYFHDEKGDVTRWSGWDRERMRQHAPEVLQAYDQMVNAEKIFRAVVRHREDHG